ncbi:MAG TPA: hypothetical protein DIC56_01350 [Rhizobium sp.]|nr:hypothetical protein [Rhizobium sp.]
MQAELGGQPVDLYLIAHEHMDHIQGALFGLSKLGVRRAARQVWMNERDKWYSAARNTGGVGNVARPAHVMTAPSLTKLYIES